MTVFCVHVRNIEGMDVYLHTFLTSVLDGGEWSASHWPLYYWGKSPWYPMDRRLGGPQMQW
jgi:hypothetical protein